MRITTITCAAAIVLALGGVASAQGMPGRDVMPPDAAAGATDLRPTGEVDGLGVRPSNNPAGVIDGTNPNPNPYQAGGILSPERNRAAETTGSVLR